MASAKIIELDDTNTCKICDNALAKYSCPRCNIIYCSLSCYQAESHLECSESFYKDNVLSELNSDPSSAESTAKIMEILQRTHENNRMPSPNFLNISDEEGDGDFDNFGLDDIGQFSQFVDIEDLEEDLDSDDEDYIDITTRLEGVNLDEPEKVWEKLTDDERQDFVAFLKTEDVSKFIPTWIPWWMHYEDKAVTTEDFKANCPEICDVKDFASITSKAPANSVKYNLINILSAYCFTVRYFNGEHSDFSNEAVAAITSVSLVLKKSVNFEDYETSVKSVEQECINCPWIITDSENLDLIRDDLSKILRGPNPQEKNFYVLCALSDLKKLLTESQKPQEPTSEPGAFAKQFPNNQFPQVQYEPKENIKKYFKRIEYFLSFSKDMLQM